MATFKYTPGRFFVPDIQFEIARENLIGYSSVLKFGRNVDVDSGAIEDIWDGGDTWNAPTITQAHNIASTNACDIGPASSGAGARTVEIQGLDGNYISQSETVTLNGTAAVETSSSYLRVFRMIVKSAGSDGINHGDITACAPIDDTVTAQISASFNQTLMAIYTVAASKTGYMTGYYASMNRSNTTGATNIFLRISADEEPFQTKHVLGLIGAGESYFRHPFNPPLRVTEKSDIKIQADASANNTDISAGFDMILVDNEQN